MKKHLCVLFLISTLVSVVWAAQPAPVSRLRVVPTPPALGNPADTNAFGANATTNNFSANGPAIPRDAQMLASDLQANLDRLRPLLSELVGPANGPIAPTPLTAPPVAGGPAVLSQVLPVLQNVRVESQELLTRLTQLNSANIGAAPAFSGTQTGTNTWGYINQGTNIISQPLTNTYGTVTNKVGGFIHRLVGAVSNEFSTPKTNPPPNYPPN